MQVFEVGAGPVHHVERADLRTWHVRDVDVTRPYVAYVDEGGEIPLQVGDGVRPDGTLRHAEPRPRERRWAEASRRGAGRVCGVSDVRAGQRVTGVDVPSEMDGVPREVGVASLVTGPVGVGGGVAGHPATEASMAGLSRSSARAVPAGGRGHAQVPVRAAECFHVPVAAVSRDAAA